VSVKDVAESNVGSHVEVVRKQHLNEVEVNLVTVIRLYILVLRGNLCVVNDINRIVNRLSAEILWCIVLWLQLVELTHLFNLRDSKVFSLESRSFGCFVHKAHKKIGLDVLPVVFEHCKEILISLLIVFVLKIHSAHKQVHISVKTLDLDVLLHEHICLLGHSILETELGVFKPSLRIFVSLVFGIWTKEIVDILDLPEVENIPFSMLTVANKIVLLAKTCELFWLFLFEVLIEAFLVLVKVEPMRC